MTISAPCPVMSDADTLRGFIATNRRGSHETCAAMQRLIDGEATWWDRDRLERFLNFRGEIYPITAAAVQRLLDGG